MALELHVLVVCVGNVCRSPMAERLLAKGFADALDPAEVVVHVSSAGVRAMVGDPMEASAAAELTRLGGDPAGFVSRQLAGPMLDRADLVLTATGDLRSRVLEQRPRALKRTFTIRELAALVAREDATGLPSVPDLVAHAAAWRGSAHLDQPDVPDPMGRSPEVHREVADLLEADCAAIVRAVVRAAKF